MATSPYLRLPGRRLHPFQNASWWLAADHLLTVTSTGYRERYRRIELDDVQALITERTSGLVRRLVVYAVLSLPLVILAVLAFETAGRIAVGVWLALLLAVAIPDLIRGPSCRFFLRTAVGCRLIPAVSRVRTARRAIDQLSPVLEARQGALDEAEARDRWEEVAPLPVSPAAEPVADSAPDADRPTYRGRFHSLLAALLALDAATSLVQALASNGAVDAVAMILFVALVAIGSIALIRGRDPRFSPPLRRWAAVVFGYLCLMVVVAMGWGVVAGLRAGLEGGTALNVDQLASYRALAGFSSAASAVLFVAWIFLQWRRRRSP